MEIRKGQVFSIGAIIFTSLLILASFSLRTPDLGTDDTVKNYFRDSLDNQVRFFNQNLEENSSLENLKYSIYSYNRFVNTTASRKGLEFDAFQGLILPDEEKAIFINYRSNQTDFTFEGDSTNSYTLSALQNRKVDISGERYEFNFTSEELSLNETVKVDGPTLIGYMRIANDRQEWRNYILR